ncbi:putative DNA-binding protein containing a Zn-ribbon domain [Geoglobus ahangari]|uniref:tRNA(Ile2) 2-agmatinylcytidine synthetase TiaS n=1 Tax=Geoglobus ahangari TaxID=113653 RepID=A0A0F7IDR7_9EURY|nr:tRNA(Ile)(2)-agmatinylcytidine synthase [Geoglobus ahangari]AKG91627.1 putative DNA-binding protein containing a Zn-ribbon domain [Geoglobus ahangari]
MRVWVGMDDTDSRKGMCTTYLAKVLMERLEESGCRVIGLPRLIRLNPNVPFKTRGNGAVSFLIECEDVGEVVDVANETVLEMAELDDENTDPGVVFVNAENDELMNVLYKFSERVIRDIVSVDEALFIVGKYLIPHLKYKRGRGLIGALASVGAECSEYTLELLAYRKPERFGTKRVYDRDSFFLADLLTYPQTFDTVDWGNDVVVCVPNSPDPVLFGIRGDSLEAVFRAFEVVRCEEIDRYQIFMTNQATDMHLIREDEVFQLFEGRSYVLGGTVIEEPFEIEGGHVFFTIETRFGDVRCAAFEPTKQFRNVIRKLRKGDRVTVYGAYKDETINLEKISIDEVARIFVEVNPACPVCGRRMESEGKGKGFRCRKCKTRAKEKVRLEVERDLEPGMYEVPPCARRHLSKPLIREGREGSHPFR